ncbi:Formin-like protein 12 [Diplonema papillatum]|nr:Formin-like protein 12 [Diplonema papillatum]
MPVPPPPPPPAARKGPPPPPPPPALKPPAKRPRDCDSAPDAKQVHWKKVCGAEPDADAAAGAPSFWRAPPHRYDAATLFKTFRSIDRKKPRKEGSDPCHQTSGTPDHALRASPGQPANTDPAAEQPHHETAWEGGGGGAAEKTVLPLQRLKNVEIALLGLGKACTVGALEAAIENIGFSDGETVDSVPGGAAAGPKGLAALKAYTDDLVMLLPVFLPTDEERALLDGVSDPSTLSAPEQILLRLGSVRLAREKVACLTLVRGFSERIDAFEKNVMTLKGAVEDALASEQLKVALATLLAIGNDLNRGRPTGRASAFAPESFEKFEQLRAGDGSGATGIDFFVSCCAADYLRLLQASLSGVTAEAAKVSLPELGQEARVLEQELALVRSSVPWPEEYREKLTSKFLASRLVARFQFLVGLANQVSRDSARLLTSLRWNGCALDQALAALVRLKHAVLTSARKLSTLPSCEQVGSAFLKQWATGALDVAVATGRFVEYSSCMALKPAADAPKARPADGGEDCGALPSPRWKTFLGEDWGWNADWAGASCE